MADPGFVKREGRESKCCTRQEKVAQQGGGGGGGLQHIFLRYLHLHYGVGVPSAYQTDLRGEKQKKNGREKKRKNGRKKGGGGGPRPIRPPLDPPL